jgi:PAS domain S-box-containing protein
MSLDSKDDSWLRAALEGSDLAAWVWELASDRIKLSEAWPEMLGEPRGEVVVQRRELAAKVHPDDLPRLVSVLDAVRRGRTPAYDIEHRIRVAGGGYRWIQSRGKVTERDASGRPLRVTGTNADITARRRAEEMLAARELQLRLVSDSVPAMIVELDADDRIRYCNRRYAEHAGCSPESFIGRPLVQAIDQGGYERFAEHRGRVRTGRPATYERTVVRPDGPEAQQLVQVVPRMERGYAGCYLMIEDVTERKRLEKMREDFIRTVTHEVRTPLQAVRAALDHIAAPGANGADLGRTVAAARTNCERLVRMVNDVLDYQRLRAGHRLLGANERVDLGAQVREAVAGNESLAREAGVELRVTAPAAQVLVPADPERITQLVTNLVANALKHSARGDAVDISVVGGERSARVSVRDHGPGVPADFQPQLFQQFAQGQSADGKQRGGTGLGLAICKAIAEQMNGRTGFEPADGPGAVFWFELPLR